MSRFSLLLSLVLVAGVAQGAARCDLVDSSRKVEIHCSSSSVAACSAAADGSNYYVVLVPDNDNGKFKDPQAGLIETCDQLWQAMNSSIQFPQDIVGVFYSDNADDGALQCTDAGCDAQPSDCVAGWNQQWGMASMSATSIADGAKLLACAFIDIHGQGRPPTAGSSLPSICHANEFTPITIAPGGNIVFSHWTTY